MVFGHIGTINRGEKVIKTPLVVLGNFSLMKYSSSTIFCLVGESSSNLVLLLYWISGLQSCIFLKHNKSGTPKDLSLSVHLNDFYSIWEDFERILRNIIRSKKKWILPASNEVVGSCCRVA